MPAGYLFLPELPQKTVSSINGAAQQMFNRENENIVKSVEFFTVMCYTISWYIFICQLILNRLSAKSL